MSLSMKIIKSALIRISFNRPLVGSFEPLGLAIVITGILIELNKSLYKSLFLLCDKDGLAIIIGFLYTPNLCLENFDESYCGYDTKQDEKSWSEYLSSGIFIGLGFVIYIELSYAAIKYENYAEQFKPAGLDISLLTNAQRKSVSKTLRTLFVSYLINLAVILFITFIIAEVVININNYLSTSDGQIQDSIELQGPYGIVFTSLIFFLLLGIIRMFIGPDNQIEET